MSEKNGGVFSTQQTFFLQYAFYDKSLSNVRIQNFDKQELEKVILIKVPSNIYSELRKIFLFLFENSGFKEIKINETVDFEELYKKRNQ